MNSLGKRLWTGHKTENKINVTVLPLSMKHLLACVCLGKSQGIEAVGALFLSEEGYNRKFNTISSVATEQFNSSHTMHLSSLHAGASRNLSGSTVCNQ